MKNILISMIKFGSEIFEMCERQINMLKRGINDAVKCIIRKIKSLD